MALSECKHWRSSNKHSKQTFIGLSIQEASTFDVLFISSLGNNDKKKDRITDLSISHDTALRKSKPESGIRAVHLNRLEQTVERLLEMATAQQGYAHVVDENAVLAPTQTLKGPTGQDSLT